MNRTQRPDWEQLPEFQRILSMHALMPFAWGVHDCAVMASRVIALGRDVELPVWSGELSARRLLKERSLLLRTLDALGDPIPWGDCVVGDVAVARQETEDYAQRYVLAVFDGHQFLAPDMVRGLRALYASNMLLGWRC